jgi:hypothetical protein
MHAASRSAEHGPAILSDGFRPQNIAIKFNQVEGVKEDVPILAAVAQSVEARHAGCASGDAGGRGRLGAMTIRVARR